MFSLRLVGPLAVVTALGIGAAPSLASSSASRPQPIVESRAPVAQAVGGDVTAVVYPGLLNVRLVRAEAAIERLITAVDTGSPTAPAELNAAAYNTSRAWKTAAYIIRTTPAPPATEGALTYTASGVPNATPEQGGIAALNLQHDLISNIIGLLGSADPTLRPAMTTTIAQVIRARNAEIAYIHSIAPPVATEGRVHAHASGAPVAVGWDTLMPDVATMVSDEITQLRGTTPVDAPTALMFANWQGRNLATVATLNRFWPPVPAEG
jgi:hypothetical protein